MTSSLVDPLTSWDMLKDLAVSVPSLGTSISHECGHLKKKKSYFKRKFLGIRVVESFILDLLIAF